MPGSTAGPTPPDGTPAAIANGLREASSEELRNTIIYAQELLINREEESFPVEPKTGEDILTVRETDGYTEVVKKIPCGEDCSDCPHGPYLYHVTEESLPTGESELHWKFLGQVASRTD